MANAVAGTAQHSHEVPSEIGNTVLMRDGNHAGTEVTRVADGFAFRSVDWHGNDYHRERCVLVTGFDVEELSEPYACDLDSPHGLALVGLDNGDDVTDWVGDCDVLWDSAEHLEGPRQ